MRRACLALIPLVLAAGLGLGCSGEQPDESTATDQSFGLVAVQFAYDQGGSGVLEPEAIEVTTTAQFVRFAAIERDRVARLLALPLNPRNDLPEIDSCQVYDQTAVLDEAETDGEGDGFVDLLEAGEVEVEAGLERLALEPRYFPGLLPFISGVVYGEAQSSRSQQPGHVLATASGSDAIGAFRVQGVTPDPLLISVKPDDSGLLAQQAAGLQLRWPSAGQAGQMAYVSIADARQVGERVLRCAVVDDGAFRIDRELLAEIVGPATEQLLIESGRVRQVAFEARGLESGELRISSTSRTNLTLPLQ